MGGEAGPEGEPGQPARLYRRSCRANRRGWAGGRAGPTIEAGLGVRAGPSREAGPAGGGWRNVRRVFYIFPFPSVYTSLLSHLETDSQLIETE